MDWNNPADRSQLIETVGADEYNRQHAEYIRASTVATINGHAIRPTMTRFGRLFAVDGAGVAFRTIGEAVARAIAETVNHAITLDDLDESCRAIQEAAGITSGDYAGIYFVNREGVWQRADSNQRRRMIDEWLSLEFADA